MHSLQAINQTPFLWISATGLQAWRRPLNRAGTRTPAGPGLARLYGCPFWPLLARYRRLPGHLARRARALA
ncbi:hypothetical protein [Marinobacterium rhizophilum]|uniref:hypothetical protein n=1 Tax=Marinobacterium rhizophilum TaxID=420402 RepID=UPI00037E4310|nr:hypothetical protein [Marinobacterium rhizophilum]